MIFNNLRLAAKLWIAVAIIISAQVFLVIGVSIRTAEQQDRMNSTLTDLNTRTRLANQWFADTLANSVRVTASVISSDPAVDASFKTAIAETTARINEVQKSIESMQLSPDEKAQMENIASNRKKVISLRDAARKMRADGNAEEALAMINAEYVPAQKIYVNALRDLVQIEEKSAAAFMIEMEQARATTSKIIAGVVVFFLLGIMAGAAWLIRSIRQPLMAANDLAARIAKGDLSMQIDTNRGDEFGDLMKSLSSMNASLGHMVNQVRNSTDSIANASNEIAVGNNDLAQRTEQTSSNLQSTASSMDHLTQTVQLSADNARQASTLAATASTVAERGGAVVRQVVTTMEEINVSSRKIADIIGVIDSIAFQTNILALNAAVEAARAGEQGRGFAVVASEVRSLAQRSAEAAKEIKTLINTSVDKVASGTQLVSDAGVTMNDIVQSVRKVVDVIGEITAASGEQSDGISEINGAIGNLDQMTQQNAALVEQSAAAAESLRDQADQLARAVAVFKTNGSSLAMQQHPPRDITPRPQALAYRRPAQLPAARAKPALASRPAAKQLGTTQKAAAPKPAGPGPMNRLAMAKTSAPAKAPVRSTPAPAADSDWETF
ncbi:MAG: methyl-accepting chemotaxis protein [Rhodoferax sp.]|uniref:methyl-accepting chemotaxis protein n=1 Tax=Rhodoferax sp. TaxID=50421 RepID=UPI002634F85E|nr:methyl-accepting chemotaxis protein [Rhodoferax sp.]MDD2882404.1 methyl-accepting chemotaxis protein [Rhodoferax sp.]